MYELIIRTQFAAAHNLRRYRGQCERLHGHNWQVEVYLQSRKVGIRSRQKDSLLNRAGSHRLNNQDELNTAGMVIDFKEAKKNINEVLKKFDHTYLNKLKEFGGKSGGLNPTTENLAGLLSEEIQKRLRRKKIKVSRVCVWESANCGACYNVE